MAVPPEKGTGLTPPGHRLQLRDLASKPRPGPGAVWSLRSQTVKSRLDCVIGRFRRLFYLGGKAGLGLLQNLLGPLGERLEVGNDVSS